MERSLLTNDLMSSCDNWFKYEVIYSIDGNKNPQIIKEIQHVDFKKLKLLELGT